MKKPPFLYQILLWCLGLYIEKQQFYRSLPNSLQATFCLFVCFFSNAQLCFLFISRKKQKKITHSFPPLDSVHFQVCQCVLLFIIEVLNNNVSTRTFCFHPTCTNLLICFRIPSIHNSFCDQGCVYMSDKKKISPDCQAHRNFRP